MLRFNLIPPDQIDAERMRFERRFSGRFFAQKMGALSMLGLSLLCGAGLVLHAVIR